MNLIFNELSVFNDVCVIDNVANLKNVITDFVDVIHGCYNYIDYVISEQLIYSFIIKNSYGINDWLNDKSISMNKRQFMRSFLNKKILIVDSDNYVNESFLLVNGDKYKAFCGIVSHEQSCPIISVSTNSEWEKNIVNGEYIDNSQVSIKCTDIEIDNVSSSDHMKIIFEKYKYEKIKNISSGQDLWERREDLFKNLIFCQTVKNQLYKDPQKNHIQQIINKLILLDDYYNKHSRYSNDQFGYNARTESDGVKNNSQLKEQRKFKKQDGFDSYFYDHISFSGNYSGRIYFLSDDSIKKIHVGYIGKHLETIKY